MEELPILLLQLQRARRHPSRAQQAHIDIPSHGLVRASVRRARSTSRSPTGPGEVFTLWGGFVSMVFAGFFTRGVCLCWQTAAKRHYADLNNLLRRALKELHTLALNQRAQV